MTAANPISSFFTPTLLRVCAANRRACVHDV
jgi:hypothetical protein